MDGIEISRKAFGWIGGDIGIAAAKAWPVRRKSMASLRKAMSEASDDDNGDKLLDVTEKRVATGRFEDTEKPNEERWK
jgi:hypothetical protein